MIRNVLFAVFVLVVSVAGAAAQSVPAELSDQQFWKLSSDFSETDGFFRSDNLLSNEIFFQYVIPELSATAKSGRVYMGVGPEQNFTYIVALKPKMVFIVDIRRGNLDLQLMYKALFEMSKDRAEFVSKLFCRPRPAGLTTQSTAKAIFAAYAGVARDEQLYTDNLVAIQNHLTSKHGFALSSGDLSGIEYVYQMFCRFGPDINYNSSAGGFGGGTNRVTYSELMTATDENGLARSFLATEENFSFMKDLETKNLVIPVVGNFGGNKAIRAVGKYLKDINATVSAFYLSNVEQYLYQDGIWTNFCANVATLPLDSTSTFIRSVRGGRFGNGIGLNSDLGNMISNLQPCTSQQQPQ
jgi:hypothetical protein